MEEDDFLKPAKTGIAIVADVIKAAGDSAEVKEAASNLGKTAIILSKTINNVLLPLAAVNFAFDKAREYFSGAFQKDLADKLSDIPDEDIIPPKPSLAGPTLQGLAFTHEEPNLKEMFLGLLANSMDSRKADITHPAFVEIIKQLSSDEAMLVSNCLQTGNSISIAQLHLTTESSKEYLVLLRHLLNLRDGDSAVEDPRLPALIDNWIKLGLVEVAYDKHIAAPESYDWVSKRPEFVRLEKANIADGKKVTVQKGIMTRTEFGSQFADAVGVDGGRVDA